MQIIVMLNEVKHLNERRGNTTYCNEISGM
jgi:hypothetical protein